METHEVISCMLIRNNLHATFVKGKSNKQSSECSTTICGQRGKWYLYLRNHWKLAQEPGMETKDYEFGVEEKLIVIIRFIQII